MSPISKALVGVFAAAALSSPAAAQGVITQKSVSLELAQAIANAAIAKCRTMGYKISVTVLDREGLQVVMMHDDGAGLNTREGSDRKGQHAAVLDRAGGVRAILHALNKSCRWPKATAV